MRHAHCRTWSMERKLKIIENEKQSLGRELWQETLKYVENEKHTLYDLEQGKKNDQQRK